MSQSVVGFIVYRYFLLVVAFCESNMAASSDAQRMEIDDEELENRLAALNEKEGTITKLSVRRIQCGDLFTTEGRLKADDKRLLNLECLDVLRREAEKELFFPSNRKLFVRGCMQDIFERLTAEKKFVYRRVLIGSPGVGKSVLFFLAALRQAQMIESDKKVIFLRQTQDDSFISVFCMEPSNESDSVNVFFSRQVDKLYFDLLSTCREIVDMFGLKDPEKRVVFVDGPRHDDKVNTLQGTFDYFCTSGGYPVPKQEEMTKIEVWILNGWNELEMIGALEAIAGVKHDEAAKTYELCGGSIRLAFTSKERGVQHIEGMWNMLVSQAPTAGKKLAIQSNQRSEDPNNYDRMRTMFEGGVGGAAIQLVDSQFLLRLLKKDASTAQIREAYQLAHVIDLASVRGGLFEELMHRWFETTKPRPITTSRRSSGTGREGVSQLDTANMYWVPSVSNFANIDAAFVCGETLVCLQYTVGQTHSFSADRFKSDLIAPLVAQRRLSFKCIEIYFVVPTGTSFTNDRAKYSLELSSPDVQLSHATRSALPLTSFEVVFGTIEVDPSTDDMITTKIPGAIPCLEK